MTPSKNPPTSHALTDTIPTNNSKWAYVLNKKERCLIWALFHAARAQVCSLVELLPPKEQLAIRLQIEELCAEFTTFVRKRPLEDDANLLIRYQGGAKVFCTPRKFQSEKRTL